MGKLRDKSKIIKKCTLVNSCKSFIFYWIVLLFYYFNQEQVMITQLHYQEQATYVIFYKECILKLK